MKQYIFDALALAYGVVMTPKTTISAVVREQRIYEGWIVWLLSMLLFIVSIYSQWDNAGVWTLIALVGGNALGIWIQSLLFHGTARLLGGVGEWQGMLAALCVASIPANIGTLAGTFAFILPEGLVGAIAFISLLWTLALWVVAIKENYQFSTGKSIATIALPIILITGIVVLGSLYLILSIASLVTGF